MLKKLQNFVRCIYNHPICCFNGPIIRNILWVFSYCHPIIPDCHNEYSEMRNGIHHNIMMNYCSIFYPLTLLFSLKAGQRRCSVKKVFLKISQISKENTFVGVSF